jgi:chemotaxis protein CheY-P-specific phosphatase CheC
MLLDEDSTSAINEIGNLCIAGGSNKISAFSNELVDISVVSADIRSREEIMLEIDPSDSCKVYLEVDVAGDIQGNFIVQFSDEILDMTIDKFPKLEAVANNLSRDEKLFELVINFFEGFADGLSGMTGLSLEAGSEAQLMTEIDFGSFPSKVLCFNSIITVGEDRIDFSVYFFSNAEILIPKVLESLGM